jgi:hypothetical protein
MKTETYSRRPFDVNAVQVTPQNAGDVAIWCNGEVGTGQYKVMGQSVKLVVVMVPGNGPNKGKMIEAKIGSWVVELNGQFRVYREKQFREEFQKIVFSESKLVPGNLVEVIDPQDPYYGFQGEVEFVEQTCITIPGVGGCMYNSFDLKRIDEYSEKTVALIADEAEANVKASSNEALDKINALRAAAEAAFKDGDLPIPHVPRTAATDRIVALAGQLDTLPEEPVTEINGIKTGYKVRVKLEANEFFGQTGRVVGLGKDGVRVLVVLTDGELAALEPIPFQSDELEVITLDVAATAGELLEKIDAHHATRLASAPTPEQINEKRAELGYPPIPPAVEVPTYLDGFKQDDMVETLSETMIDGLEIPAGTTGRVTVVEIDMPGSPEFGIEVLFSDGRYGHFFTNELKKI